MKRILFFTLISLFALPAGADEIGIKGLTLGMSTDDFLKAYPHKSGGFMGSPSGGSCHKMNSQIDRCDYVKDIDDPKSGFTIGGVPSSPELVFEHNKLVEISVTFPHPDMNFDDVFKAFVAKFSQPTAIKTPTLGNAYGATVQDVQAVWTFPAGSIVLEKYGTLDQSNLLIRSKAYQDELDAKQNAKKNDL